ncbi:lactate utilization protein [Clostridium sp. A1-XYC3]|uniref:Lactate utilization protein n=1 Tax=Clostridium tanneri TaxID=3037988 RepID=A0ABU4JN51_9CLOT|nr:lactate utilization protein [Clostridium sp. A1-XYC3]MDW8799540.1 lactate utilization protein [Clostridium sp. A1-XYC3]
MDKNTEWVMEQKVKRTIENLEKNNMDAYFVQDEKALVEKISEFVTDGDTVSVGGSMTLFETGVIEFLRKGKFNFLDRYKEGLTAADTKDIFRKSFLADAYFVSSNAVTEKGELYNVDGNGNRVAAMLYGPDKVIVIVGVNKIVKDVDEAIKRTKGCAAPANTKRLNRNTPCTKVGYCVECSSDERICNDYVLMRKQAQKGRVKVIIVGKELGY